MLFFLLLMLLFRSVCHQVPNQADKLDFLAIVFIISRRFTHQFKWASLGETSAVKKNRQKMYFICWMCKQIWHIAKILENFLENEICCVIFGVIAYFFKIDSMEKIFFPTKKAQFL